MRDGFQWLLEKCDHEAYHAAIPAMRGHRLLRVSVHPDQGLEGLVEWADTIDTVIASAGNERQFLHDRLVSMRMAGYAGSPWDDKGPCRRDKRIFESWCDLLDFRPVLIEHECDELAGDPEFNRVELAFSERLFQLRDMDADNILQLLRELDLPLPKGGR